MLVQLEYLQQRNAELEKQVRELERALGSEKRREHELKQSRSRDDLRFELPHADKTARRYVRLLLPFL